MDQDQQGLPGEAKSWVTRIEEQLEQEQALCKEAHVAAVKAVKVANQALHETDEAKARIAQLQQDLIDIKQRLICEKDSTGSAVIASLAQAAKERCEKDITAYCEAAVVEELISSYELDEMLHTDVNILIQESLENMGACPATVRKEIQSSLLAFAEAEITTALHINSENIAVQVSKVVDAALKTLEEECLDIEQTKLPMTKELLRQQFMVLLKRELERIEKLPIGPQGKCGVEMKCGRVR